MAPIIVGLVLVGLALLLRDTPTDMPRTRAVGLRILAGGGVLFTLIGVSQLLWSRIVA